MKRLNRCVLRQCAAAALILIAAAAWPSAGWSRPYARACNVNKVVITLLHNWANKLAQSTSSDPAPIVGTYGADAVLLPTCANGPLTGRDQIKVYFEGFLKQQPVVAFNASMKIGGECTHPFASGLYTFTLNGGTGAQLHARYTYIFAQTHPGAWLIAQHHSSLEPESKSECPH